MLSMHLRQLTRKPTRIIIFILILGAAYGVFLRKSELICKQYA